MLSTIYVQIMTICCPLDVTVYVHVQVMTNIYCPLDVTVYVQIIISIHGNSTADSPQLSHFLHFCAEHIC